MCNKYIYGLIKNTKGKQDRFRDEGKKTENQDENQIGLPTGYTIQ